MAPDLPTALLHVTTMALAATTMWLLLVTAMSTWRPTARWAVAMTPRFLRAAVLTSVSGAMAFSPVAADDLDGLPLPDRQAGGSEVEHVVVRGESLWSIAAGTLDAGSSPADIADASMRWYHTNRATVGANPDLIYPGQVLSEPEAQR